MLLNPRDLIHEFNVTSYVQRKQFFVAAREARERQKRVRPTAEQLAEQKLADVDVATHFVKGLVLSMEYIHGRCWDLAYIYPYINGPRGSALSVLGHSQDMVSPDLRPTHRLRSLTPAESSILLLGGISSAAELVLPALQPLLAPRTRASLATAINVYFGWNKERFLDSVPATVEVVQEVVRERAALAERVLSANQPIDGMSVKDASALLHLHRYDCAATSFVMRPPHAHRRGRAPSIYVTKRVSCTPPALITSLYGVDPASAPELGSLHGTHSSRAFSTSSSLSDLRSTRTPSRQTVLSSFQAALSRADFYSRPACAPRHCYSSLPSAYAPCSRSPPPLCGVPFLPCVSLSSSPSLAITMPFFGSPPLRTASSGRAAPLFYPVLPSLGALPASSTAIVFRALQYSIRLLK
mmetsp:Transcript_42448/g.107120  ORF Transcript_42448/g.107120 Transcript_42448/m.107120 type:complete len:411 (+) Transcript_42448:1014-2246(+)